MLVIDSKSLYLFCQFYGWNTKIDAKVKRKFGWCYDTQMWLLGAYPKPQNFAPKSMFPYIYLRDHVKTLSHSLYEDAFAFINMHTRAYACTCIDVYKRVKWTCIDVHKRA